MGERSGCIAIFQIVAPYTEQYILATCGLDILTSASLKIFFLFLIFNFPATQVGTEVLFQLDS
jgi:hypothetical protein